MVIACGPQVAAAQVTDEQDTAAPPANVIIVSGSIRESQEAAIETKRAAINYVDVASADSVGRFPDENTAAALARLPGVAVQRDQGQARYIQVRGAPNRWTSVSIDGIPQTGTDEGGDSRAYRFDAIPAVLLQQLVVNKSLTPDLTAEAITANVDMQTFSPLRDTNGGFTANGELGYGFMDLGGGEQRSAAARMSWSNDIIGVALGGSHYQRDQVTDNREAGYDENGVPIDIDVRSYQLQRSNNGLFGTLEVQASDDLRLFLRGIYTQFTDKERRNAYEIELADAGATGRREALSGELFNVPVTTNFNDGEYINENIILSAGFDYDNADGFGIGLDLGYTRTENTTDLPLLQSSIRGLSVIYDRTADLRFPMVQLFRTAGTAQTGFSRGEPLADLPQNEQSLPRTVLLPLVQAVVSDAYTAKIDASREVGSGTLRAGLYGTRREISGNNLGLGGTISLASLGFDPNAYATNERWDTRFPLGFRPFNVDNISLNNALQGALAANDIDMADLVLPTAYYDQEETILAGYVSGDIGEGPLTVNAGARVEYYEVQNAGTALVGSTPTPLSATQDFFDIFPSVNLRYEAGDNLVLRLAGQRGISRPAYAAIRVGASINDTSQTIGGGNPALRPEYTWGVDASAEYYFASNGILSVGAFHRWVDDVLYQSQSPVTSDLYDAGGQDRTGYLLSSTFNGDRGRLYGVEFNIEHQLDFLPGALSGFGVQANLTLLDGEFDALNSVTQRMETHAFQGLSDTVANASLFYEYGPLSARVAYQWRSEYLDTLGGLGAGEFRDGYENLDVTVRYAVTDNITLFADLANLTDEIYLAYEGTPGTPTEVEQVGARYLFGLRFAF